MSTTDVAVMALDLRDLLEIVRARPEAEEAWIRVKVAQISEDMLADDAPLPVDLYLGPFELH